MEYHHKIYELKKRSHYEKNLIFLFSLLGICILAGCTQYAGQDPEESEDYIMTEENAFILKDGASVSLWEPYEDSLIHSYRLENGQELPDF